MSSYFQLGQFYQGGDVSAGVFSNPSASLQGIFSSSGTPTAMPSSTSDDTTSFYSPDLSLVPDLSLNLPVTPVVTSGGAPTTPTTAPSSGGIPWVLIGGLGFLYIAMRRK